MIIDFSEGDGGKMITVVIPALNESATIASIVRFAKRCPQVDEVIVVDDGSVDGTAKIAAKAGARVITSSLLGKGASMEDGMREARNETVVYLDGDLQGLRRDVIEVIARPVLEGEADFVKAKFARAAGRVTVLTAKPLLRTYFPELAEIDQPLGGIIAARRGLLRQLHFENDYGVDVGLLIDAHRAGARIAEVDIGPIEHRSHALGALGDMATQVARAVLERAARAGRLRPSYLRNSKERERQERLSLEGFLNAVPPSDKLALFDMDGVLLDGRFVVALAQATNKEEELHGLLDNGALPAKERAKKIAAAFGGIRREQFEAVAKEIPLMPGAVEAVVGLRRAGYRVGIVTDSYHCAADIVRRRVFADFCFSHFLQFKNGRASGQLNLCPAMIHTEGCAVHDHCKANVLKHLSDRLSLPANRFLAVGDGANDVCLLRAAGISVAFQPKSDEVKAAGRYVADALGDVLAFAGIQRRTNYGNRLGNEALLMDRGQ